MKNYTWLKHIHVVMQFGLTMAGSIVFCFFIGRLLDRWLGTGGIFVTIFILLGIAGGANVAYRQIRAVLYEDQQQKKEDPHQDE